MWWQRPLLCFFCIAALVVARGQHSYDWLPVTDRDLQMDAVPGDSEAVAVQLYYADFRDDAHKSEFIYKRIKILKESGAKYANVEIEIPQHSTLADLQARTIHPNKAVIEFRGRPFEKIVAKYRGERLVAKVFTLPGVTVGSLVEYKFRLLWNQYFSDPVWVLQHDLYTVQESFWLLRYAGSMPTRHIDDPTQLSYVTSNLPSGVVPKDTGAAVELEVENVPAFKPEPFMPPEANFKPEVQFFYGGREIESPEVFWKDVGRDWYEKSEHFTGNHEALKAAALQIIDGESDAEKQLRKLYARVQQTRNLSFENERAGREKRSSGLKPNENVMDVFTRGYGTQNQIAELFAALARAAGFTAQVLRASDRSERVFDPKLLSEKQLATELVRVRKEDLDLFLDPGTAFCPFGLVAWTSTSAPALQLGNSGGSFVVVPTPTADRSLVRRTGRLTLEADGSVHGEITVEFKGNEALERRLRALTTDDPGRKRSLENELQFWLPAGFEVEFQDAEGWESSEDPLVAHFTVKQKNFATAAGGREIVPSNLFRLPEAEAFSAEERKYPVYFPYTYEAIDKVNVQIPLGFRLETIPDGHDVKTNSTRFITTRSLQEQQLLLTRALVVNSIYFQPEQYDGLKRFFGQLRATDEEQIVLVRH